MKKQIIALSAALLVVFTACEKDEKTQPVVKEKTKSQLLTQKAWDLEKTHVTSKAGGVVIIDEDFPMQGTVEFKAGGTGVSNIPGEGTESFNWQLKGDSLFVDGEGALITKLTASQFEMMASFTEVDSLMGQLDVTLTTSMTR